MYVQLYFAGVKCPRSAVKRGPKRRDARMREMEMKQSKESRTNLEIRVTIELGLYEMVRLSMSETTMPALCRC